MPSVGKEMVMDRRFRPLLAAAFAAGVIPILDRKSDQAQGAALTVAGFNFESASMLTTSTGALSYSYAADVGSGTMTLAHSAGSINSVSGNPSHALTANQMYGGASYTFQFSLDSITNLGISFDMTGSATGPRDFQVLYGFDGVSSNFQSFAAFALSTMSVTATGTAAGNPTSTATTFAFSSSASAWNLSFSVPTAFSESAPGQSGFLQILQVGSTAINGGGTGAAGTNRIDNILITSSTVPEPATASVMTLAAAALAMRRRQTSR
jgi:hypothetical protein